MPTARHKLNSAHLVGALVVAGVLGFITRSPTVFVLAAGTLIVYPSTRAKSGSKGPRNRNIRGLRGWVFGPVWERIRAIDRVAPPASRSAHVPAESFARHAVFHRLEGAHVTLRGRAKKMG